MKRMIDQTLLTAYCFIALLLVPVNTKFICAFLTVVICACLNTYLNDRKCMVVSAVCYLAAAVLWSEFLYFAPVILYSVFRRKQYIFSAGIILLCLYRYFPQQPKLLCIFVIGCGISFVLQERDRRNEELEQRLRMIRDDSTELNLLLKEKNKDLLLKQDNEIYTATLKERNRIAREIHDNVGHMLSRSILMVGAMKAISQEEHMKEPLMQLEDTLNTAMNNVRESVHDLHDEAVNLKEVLEGLIKDYTFCQVQMDYDMGCEIPREVKYSFIAIVKEALNNVIKHSNATKVQIIVREHPGLYQLVVEDNGTLFEKEEIRKKKELHKGMGLNNMEERAKVMGGTFQIRTEPGFRIYITVPKKEETV